MASPSIQKRQGKASVPAMPATPTRGPIATPGGGDPAVIARFVAATGGPDALIERTLR